MTRVSLTEDYDDRSVISKLNEMDKRVKENASVVTSAEASARQSAQSAQETADRFAGSVGAVVQNANAQINASKVLVDQAKAEVDETVTTVAQAVQTANQASASAQQSATTVATYGARLTAVEDKAQGNSADIQHLEIETRDLYDRDANSVKLHPAGDQHLSGTLFIDAWSAYGPQQFKLRGTQLDNWKVIGISDSQGDVNKIQMTREETQFIGDKVYRNTVPSNADSRSIVNKAYVESTDGVTNNLVHKSANETIYGVKTFDALDGCVYYHSANTDNSADNVWRKAFSLTMPDNANLSLEISSMFNNSDVQDAKIRINKRAGVLGCVVLDSVGTISAMASASNYVAVCDDDVVTLYVKKVRRYTNLFIRITAYNNYGYHLQLPTVTYLNAPAVDPSTEEHDIITVGVRPAYRNVE